MLHPRPSGWANIWEKFYSLITTRAVGVSHLQSTTCSSTVSDTVYSSTLSAWLLTGPKERIWTLSNSFIATLLSEAKARKNKRCRCEWTHGLTLVASVSFLNDSLSLLSVIMYFRRCVLSLVASKIINQKALNVRKLLNFRSRDNLQGQTTKISIISEVRAIVRGHASPLASLTNEMQRNQKLICCYWAVTGLWRLSMTKTIVFIVVFTKMCKWV